MCYVSKVLKLYKLYNIISNYAKMSIYFLGKFGDKSHMKYILIVEDEHSIAELYKTKLGLHNFRVRIAYNGLEALKEIELDLPDLILLDLRMPVMDGETFLDKCRKINRYEDIPVIILTNISREEAPKTIWHYGISGYFVKAHHTPSDLLKVVEKTLDIHHEE